jgi:hypothetical protein
MNGDQPHAAFHVEVLEGLSRPAIAVRVEVGMPFTADAADLETEASGRAGCVAVEHEKLHRRACPPFLHPRSPGTSSRPHMISV